jgi:hypothetical protein
MGKALDKSRKFAIRIYNLYKHLYEEKHEYTATDGGSSNALGGVFTQ